MPWANIYINNTLTEMDNLGKCKKIIIITCDICYFLHISDNFKVKCPVSGAKNCHGSWAHGLILALLCVCVCAGVCVWVCLTQADSLQLQIIYRAILDPVTLSFVVRSLDCLPCPGQWFPSVPASWFRDSRSLPFLDSVTGHLAAHCFPVLPALPTWCATYFPQFTCSDVFFNKPFLFPQLESSSLYL